MIKKSFGLKWSIDTQKHTHVDSKFWTHAKTFLRYLQLQEMQLFRKFGFYPASTFAKKLLQEQKKLCHTRTWLPPCYRFLYSPCPLVGSTLDFIFKKPACILYFINLNYYSSLSVIGLISHPIGILYLAPVMLGRSTTHEAISVEKRMPLDDWQHQWFAIA